MNDILSELLGNSDPKYKNFTSSLIPTVPPEKIIGVRTPILRKIAKNIYNENETVKFMNSLPHTYYEENSLHAFLIEQIKDYDECINALKRFLPYIDNWSTCDCMNPKCLSKHKESLLGEICIWLNSSHVYTVRYAIKLLMSHYLNDDFDENYLYLVSRIHSDEYYINMMIAWYFATALAKQWEAAIPYIVDRKLPVCAHNKAIQKATESRRITPSQKEFLKSYKIK